MISSMRAPIVSTTRRLRSLISPDTASSLPTTLFSNTPIRSSNVSAIWSARPPSVALISSALAERVSGQLARAREENGVDVLHLLVERMDDLASALAEHMRHVDGVFRERFLEALIGRGKAGVDAADEPLDAIGRLARLLVRHRLEGFDLRRHHLRDLVGALAELFDEDKTTV